MNYINKSSTANAWFDAYYWARVSAMNMWLDGSRKYPLAGTHFRRRQRNCTLRRNKLSNAASLAYKGARNYRLSAWIPFVRGTRDILKKTIDRCHQGWPPLGWEVCQVGALESVGEDDPNDYSNWTQTPHPPSRGISSNLILLKPLHASMITITPRSYSCVRSPVDSRTNRDLPKPSASRTSSSYISKPLTVYISSIQ